MKTAIAPASSWTAPEPRLYRGVVRAGSPSRYTRSRGARLDSVAGPDAIMWRGAP